MAFVKGFDRGETMLLPPSVDDFVDRENPVRAADAFVDSLDLQALGFELRDEFAIDGTFIKAVNSRAKSYTAKQLRKLVEKIDRAARHYLDQLEALDTQENQLTLTDPDSRQLHKCGKTTVGDNVHTAVDSKHHLIAACEVTQDAGTVR